MMTLARSLILMTVLALPIIGCNSPAAPKAAETSATAPARDGKQDKASKEDRKADKLERKAARKALKAARHL
jgi:hypothetical protein